MDSNYIDKKPLFGWLLQHDFYVFGNPKKISWVLKDEESTSEQIREHAEMYLDKITDEQSKYVALHVGIFWCIGTFRIKDEDTVNVILDSKTMFEHIANQISVEDEFITKRTVFIRQLIAQRKLNVNYKYDEKNLAKNLIT